MCGIGGILLHHSDTQSEVSLHAMTDLMRARGPDDAGVYVAPHIGLVHTRLSILDLSPTAKCPMQSADGSTVIVFNGEIYNWRELRADLEARGVSFLTRSDTEVVLHGFRAWGTSVFARLRGMFAIAIWDATSQALVLARDRAGEKPLFYSQNADGIMFGSTPRLFDSAPQGTEVSAEAIACYLAHTFIPAPKTIYPSVSVLPPAHFLHISVAGATGLVRYWDFPTCRPTRARVSACEEAVEAVLEDSVTRCLDADVPVGLFLSGGVDSSLVAALASRHRKRLPAFTIGFGDPKFSEIPYAEQVARHLDLEHHTAVVTADDVVKWLPYLVEQYGQPFGDSSALPTYALARLARRHVTVCLCGDGGDESFAGYWRTQSNIYASRFAAAIPSPIRRHVVPGFARALGPLGSRLQAMNTLSLQPAGSGYTNSQSWYGCMAEIAGPMLERVLSSDLAAMRAGRHEHRARDTVMQRLLYDDFVTQLPDAYLTKVDVASMAASLEVRAPFLDQPVIETAWTLPDSVKLRWGQRKWLLKRIAAKLVPPATVYRRKMGFGMPLAAWFRSSLGEYLNSMMSNSLAADNGWIRNEAVLRALADHQRGEDHSTRLWLALWLEMWFRQRQSQNKPGDARC
jgi:asparagine synthase (glutamine-hydrolysing)